MDADLHDEFGFPLPLSERFRGHTMLFTLRHPQSSATQEEDWYEIQVPRHRNESTALGKDRVIRGTRDHAGDSSVESIHGGVEGSWFDSKSPGQKNEASLHAYRPHSRYQALPVDTTTACIGRLPGEAFWAWAARMGRGGE